MEYRLKINAEIVPVQADEGPENNLKIAMTGQQFDVDWQVIGDNMIHLLVNGRDMSEVMLVMQQPVSFFVLLGDKIQLRQTVLGLQLGTIASQLK